MISMGIPSYFVHLVKNHSSIIKQYDSTKINIENLYLDSNSIIYDAVQNVKYEKNDSNFENKLIKWIYDKIIFYVNLIKPKKLLYVAFDGVAPLAKLEQQRSRRYKGWYTNNYLQDKIIEKWDTTAITPGTNFMMLLSNKIKKYFENNFNNDYKTKIKVIVSSSDEVGEGEHKIFKYIRSEKKYHINTNTVIYGLDADLIMLTLLHSCEIDNLYLFRETPYFIKSIDDTLLPNQLYVMDIKELGFKIINTMCINIPDTNYTFKKEVYNDYINDYVFICFLLGNDFMPHFPAINIRTNGINILLDVYKNLFGGNNDYIIKNDKIQWKNFKKFIGLIKDNENYYCRNEEIIRKKQEKKIMNKLSRLDDDNEKLLNIPLLERNIEKIIDIGEDGWHERYYLELFFIEINDIRRKQICINYLEGLEWNYKYYKSGCPDWRWKYKYNYPPTLFDLYAFIPYFETTFIESNNNKPVKPLVQLAYVLPRNSLFLLPKKLHEKLILDYEEIYRLDFKINWSFCRYFWEAHIELPDLKIEILETLVENLVEN